MFIWLAYNASAASWTSPNWEGPIAPLRQELSITKDSWDIQLHNRDNPVQWDAPMQAEHGPNCEGPPLTHTIQDVRDGAYVCNGHIMTAANAQGYGEIVLTPDHLLDCSTSCVLDFNLSTQRMSSRDWIVIDLTPWIDNLTLPFETDNPDLQGPPKNGLTITIANAIGFNLILNNNGVSTTYSQCCAKFNDGISTGTNQAAARQPFKLTITSGRVRFERMPSSTGTAVVYIDQEVPVQLRSDYVVQFEHHSYNPEKDDSGLPATWHWGSFGMSNAVPFTMIKPAANQSRILFGNNPVSVTFAQPAPANAYLRFSGICGILTDANGLMTLAPKQTYLGHPEHVSSYFIPIQQGKQTVNFQFTGDDWYTGCPGHIKDLSIWSKGGSQPVPTPTPISTATPVPTATRTPVIVPTATNTPIIQPTATRTPTPTGIRRQCTLRWGSTTIEVYGNLTQAECASRGQ